MKPTTVKGWINAFPVSLRDKINANHPHALAALCDDPGKAIDRALSWSGTKERGDFWHGVHHALGGSIHAGPSVRALETFQAGFKLGIEAKNHLNQLSAEAAPAAEALTQTPTHTMHPKYSDQPVAQITAVFGTDVSTMSASDCLNAIKSNNAAVKALTDTGITGPYVDEQVNNYKAANEVLLARLNSFVKAPTA